MLRNNRLYAGVFLFVIAILCSACGAKTSKNVQLDSGTQNQSYQGVVQPVVPKTLKLSEVEQKNGIQKFPIRSSSEQSLTPAVQVTHTLPEERQVDVNVKPHL